MRTIIAILVLGFLWASPSFAQTKGNLLRGAKTLYVIIDIAPEKKSKCSINEKDIVSAYKFPFSNSKIVLSENPVGPDLTLYINVNSLEIDVGSRLVGCAFHILFRVTSYIVDTIPFNIKQWSFDANLYSDDNLNISSVSDFRNSVRKIIEEKAKNFITAYNLDNK